MNESEKVKGDLCSILLDYPYSFPYAFQEKDIRLIPPIDFINKLLKSEGTSGGMSPGCTWKSMSISEEEYEKLIQKLLEFDFESHTDIYPYAPKRLILDEELNKNFPKKEDWEKQQILKYIGVHEFIEFYDEYKPSLYLNSENYGTIEIFGTTGGPQYFGHLTSSKEIKPLFGNKIINTDKVEMIHEWIKYNEKFSKTEWYKATEEMSVSDSWGRQPKILEAYISNNSFISFKTDFKEIKPSINNII
ncbi:hypothetical protein HNQ88_002562 [Aureibacter tunicatorum]|uniref:Uncharacterized protein n=2 Tax=Aureibacter tunicatorum TaxID=866807 RepID=A0AAE4BQT4_9BACT|nr:hypothetical protein [Aureibacter tunicatorum]